MEKKDFKEVPLTNIEGKTEFINCCKEIGNILYNNGMDVAVCEIGKQIYNGEEVELTDECKDIIRRTMANFPYIVRKAVEDYIV